MITDHRDENGVIRRLARLEPNSEQKLMRASRTNIQTYRQANNLPGLIPQSEWVEIDNRAIFDDRFILDQEQHGSCTGFSDACAAMKVVFLTTGELFRFSGAFVYALIDGGSDNGSVITDAMISNEQTGQVLESQFSSRDLIFRGRPQVIPDALISSAAQFKSTFDMTVGSWLEAMTCIQMGFIWQGPIQVGSNNFESYDQYGAPGFSNGPGNHSVHCDGCIKLPNGQWALTMMNSWGKWGPKQDGRCLLYQRHIDGAGTADDGFAHCSMLTQNPPVPA